MHLSFLPLALLATKVLADGAAIVAQITTISDATVALNNTVANFPDSVLADLPSLLSLLGESSTLLNDINKATYVAQQSANLTLDETFAVAGATLSLASTVESTLSNIIATKPKFDKLLLVSPVLLSNLKQEKSATDNFGAAVVEKVPQGLQATAQSLLAPIDDKFDEAIAAYEVFAL